MAPPKRPWFRFYVEALTDPKLRRLSAEERWLWVVVLGLARQSPLPGWLLVTESIPMEPDDMSEMAGVTAAKVGKGLGKMVDLGLLVHDLDLGAYRVTKWDERQFESDDVGKRTAKHRSKNVEATPMERPNDVDVSAPDTESEADTESSSSSVTASPPVGPDDEVWQALADLRFSARKGDPVSSREAWTKRVTDDDRRKLDRTLTAFRAKWPAATAEQLARALFDGTNPPAPPKPVACSECGGTFPGLDALYAHHDNGCSETIAAGGLTG